MLKKTAATLLITAGLVASTYGQGTVYFRTQNLGIGAKVTDDPGHGGALVGAPSYGPGFKGTNWFAQLYAASGAGRLEEELVPIGEPVNFQSGSLAGWVQTSGTTSLGWVITLGSKTNRMVVTNSAVVPPGGPMTVQLRAWWGGGNVITNYHQAEWSGNPNARHGRSSLVTHSFTWNPSPVVGLHKTGNPLSDPPSTPIDLGGTNDYQYTWVTNVVYGTNVGTIVDTNVVTWLLQGFQLMTNPPLADLVGPAIVTPNIVANAGGSVTFGVNVVGFPLSYQWRHLGVPIPGRTLSYLTLSGVQNGDEGNYDVVITQEVPTKLGPGTQIISSPGSLLVNDPYIATQPANATASYTSNATFTVVAEGTPTLLYQWKRGITPLSNDSKYSGVNTATLTVSSVIGLDGTNGLYSVDVTGADGLITSSGATLTVVYMPTALAITGPVSRTNNAGTTATFSATATDGTAPFTYQWYKGLTALLNGGNISGVDTATLTLTGVLKGADAATNYNVRISNISGTAQSTNAELAVIDPVFNVQPVDQIVNAGENATFTVDASGTALTYQWQRYNTNIAGANGASHEILNVQPANDFEQYRVVIANQFGTLTSTNATLVVNPPLGDTANPKVKIGSPIAGDFTTNQIVVTGSVSDDKRVARAEMRVNEGSWFPIPMTVLISKRTAGAFTNLTTLATGTNTVEVRGWDASGKSNYPPAIIKYFYQVPGTLTLVTNGNGNLTIAPATYYVGRSYTFAATPTLNNLLSNVMQTVPTPATNIVAGTPEKTAIAGVSGIAFKMSTNTTLTANFNTNAFNVFAGIYHGLIQDTNNGVTHASAGYITFKVDSKLKYTGKVYVHGEKVSFGGIFDLGGVGKQKALVYRKGLLDPIIVVPRLDLTGNQRISGTVSNAGWTADIDADLNIYGKLSTNSPPGLVVNNDFTIILPGSPDATVEPGGCGYMTLAFKGKYDQTKGVDFKPKGLLGDTQKFKPMKVPMSKTGRWPFYATAYDGLRGVEKTTYGSLWGWLQFTNNGTVPTTTILGDVTWTKVPGWTPVAPLVDLYPAGFSNTLTIAASVFTTPALGTRAIEITDGVVTMTEGNLTPWFANDEWDWQTDNKIIFPKMVVLGTGLNPWGMKLTVNVKDGTMKGEFIHNRDSVKKKITGAILQNGPFANTAWGNWMGVSGVGSQSGSMVITNEVVIP